MVQDLPGPDLKRGQGGKGELGGAEVVEGQGQLKPHYFMDQPPPKSWWGLGSPEGCLTAGWPAPDEKISDLEPGWQTMWLVTRWL